MILDIIIIFSFVSLISIVVIGLFIISKLQIIIYRNEQQIEQNEKMIELLSLNESEKEN